jgi:hypothetical protein
MSEALVQLLLSTALKDTDGLLLDLRFNGGGFAQEAQTIINFFQLNSTLLKDKFLMNEFTESYVKELNLTFTPGGYSSPTLLFPDQNVLGMAYVKPVGIFTSGFCKSFLKF